MPFQILPADLSVPMHAEGLVNVLDSYAKEPAGGGEPLREDVRKNLIAELSQVPTLVALLAIDVDRVVGAAVCFLGFSTFAARPLLNIHDLAVLPGRRGQGIGTALLNAVAEEARRRGCCKLTLEVFDENQRARKLYGEFGFQDYAAGGSSGARFLSKPIAHVEPSHGV